MKKFIGLILAALMIFAASAPLAFAEDVAPSLSVTVRHGSSLGYVYTMHPFTLQAVFDSGTQTSGAYPADRFIKASWLRVEELESGADLNQVYADNKEKENLITKQSEWYGGSYKIRFDLDICLNGTYIFCGWISDTSGAPQFIKRVDINEIETERPMADIEFKNFGDYSKDTIASASIRNMECGKGKTIKRYALVKDYLLPPGSWPESLPPDYCNAQYDDMISKLMDSFINSGLEVKPDENGAYNLKYTGSYKLFIEDSEGKYTVVTKELSKPSQVDTKPPEIDFDVTIPASENEPSEIKVTAADNIGIARIDYADVELKQIGRSDNGTDEFFLTERKPISASGGTIKTDRSIVICAVDTSGNASYERVDIGNEPEPTNEPDETSSPIPTATAAPDVTSSPMPSATAEPDASGAPSPSATAEPQPTDKPEDHPYEIGGLSILTQAGEKLEAPPENGSFEAEVTLKKLKAESSKDYIFVAVYNEEGILLNIDYVRADFAPDYDYSFGFNIPPQTRKIGSIKAFVWSDFSSAEPLSETKEISFK